MESLNKKINSNISAYYSEKVNTFGATPQGVDWNNEDGQLLRFKQLASLIKENKKFSIADLGCGYGAMYEWLCLNYSSFKYYGFDISKDMIEIASKKHIFSNAYFHCSSEPNQKVDYCVASGIFNIRLIYSDSDWLDHIKNTLKNLNYYSIHGFSFNCLTSYSDEDKKKDYLYYANPLELFDYCKKSFSKQVSLLHDYGLYEFTIIVRK